MLHDPASLALLAGALLLSGAVAGLVAGLLGVGGGIVIVPVLFQLFSVLGFDEAVRMHLAVGTSLSTIVATSIVSMRSHARRGGVDWELFRRWAPAIAVGVIGGTLIAAVVRGTALSAVFATVALVVAGYMSLAPDSLRLTDRLPGGAVLAAIGAAIGGISAMMGIGGGTLTVPTLVLCNYPIRRAVGTAAAVGLLIGVPGTIGFVASGWGEPDLPPLSLGYVSVLGFAVLTPATVLCAPYGAKLAHSIKPRTLRLAFAAFLLATSVKMYLSLL